jgi:hypothetical protein
MSHTPAWQEARSPPGQLFPHVPQSEVLVARSTQAPPQPESPELHGTQAPALHLDVGAQALSQRSQCASSFTQASSQTRSPSGHAQWPIAQEPPAGQAWSQAPQ